MMIVTQNLDPPKVISLDDAERAFFEWAKHIEDSLNEPLMIHSEHARRAAEAFFAQIQINRGEQPNIKRVS